MPRSRSNPGAELRRINELRQTGDPHEQLRDIDKTFESLAARHRSTDYVEKEAAEIIARKNFAATGSFIAEDRGRALDLLGFASQLIFNTFHNSRLCAWEHSGDLELAIGAARAHNRAMIEFCSTDPRLLATLYVPLADLDRAGDLAAEAISMGLRRCWSPPVALRRTRRATSRSMPCGRRPARLASLSSSTWVAPEN